MSTGGVGSQNLDTRLLRFRARRGEEDAVALAEDLLAAGRSDDAQEVVTAALRSNPEAPALLVADGRARLAIGDVLGAQASLLKAARVSPERKEPFRWLGEVLLQRGDPDRASKVLARAKAIDPTDPGVLRLLEHAERLRRDSGRVDPPATGPRSSPTWEAGATAEDMFPEEKTTDFRPTSPPRGAGEESGRAPAASAPNAAGKRPPFPPVGLASAPPRRESRQVKQTLTFGSAAEGGVAPPRGRLPGKGLPSPMPPSLSTPRTSPGAATAPVPPPPKRSLGSKPLGAPVGRGKVLDVSDEDIDIDDALGVLRGPRSGPPRPPPSDPPPEAVFPPPRTSAALPEPSAAAAAAPAMTPFPPPSATTAAPVPELGSSSGAIDLDESLDAPFERAAAVPFGGGEDVDAILRMLRDHGLFEPSPESSSPGSSGPAPLQWAGRRDVKATQTGGTRVGLWVGLAWLLAVGLAVGGWYGWQGWVEHRHLRAAQFVEQAKNEAYRGDHADLVDAERHLREARDLNPQDRSGPTLMLFVHSQRALEDGAFEAGFMRPSIARVERMLDVEPEGGDDMRAYLAAARAVVAAAEGSFERARERLAEAHSLRPRDPAILYLAGRLEQRLGGDEALGHLEAAAQGQDDLNAARIALAEALHDQGRVDEALERLEQVLGEHAEHLRARLWRGFLTSDTTEPQVGLSHVSDLEGAVEQEGAPTDQVLLALTRSRLLRRQGESEAAGEAVDYALRAGASEPRLLALVATEGRRAGRLLRAEQAARTAVQGAPSNPDFKKLLGEIQLARRNGRAALETLAELDAGDPEVLRMRGEAALLLGSEEALSAAAEALDSYVEAHEDASIEVRALRVRVRARTGEARPLFSVARALVAEAPGDPGAALALGEVALRLYDAATAVESLEQVVQASPDDAEGHFLLGRARRMAGDGEGAEASLRRAIERTPEHIEARLALGGLLLDRGRHQAADELYSELSSSASLAGGQAVTVAGRLGRVEALVGLGRLDDAQVQLEALQEEAQETPSARITAARLFLAQGQAGRALSRLRPLATGENPSASVLALYGDALLAAGQADPAAQAYEQALQADAGLPEALLGQAEMKVRANRADDALEILGRAARVLEQRIRPPALHARMHLLTGRAHLDAGRTEAARQALRAAIEFETAPPEAHFFLGEALAGENSPDARAAYERYLELAPEGAYAARARRAVR